MIQLDPEVIIVGAPAPAELTGTPIDHFIPDGAGGHHEFHIPHKPIQTKYIQAQLIVEIKAVFKQEHGEVQVTVSKDGAKFELEKDVSEHLKGVLEINVENEDEFLEKLSEAVKKRSASEFAKTLAEPFQASVKRVHHLHWLEGASVEASGGLQFSEMPVAAKIAFAYETHVIMESFPFLGEFKGTGEIRIGPSRALWLKIGEKVGKPILQTFLKQGGRALTAVAEWFGVESAAAAAGALAAVAIGTVGLVALTTWITGDARRRGELTGLATWYTSAYVAKTFGQLPPISDTNYGFTPDQIKMRDQLIIAGQQDAVRDARTGLTRVGNSAAGGSEFQVLQAWRAALIAASDGNQGHAEAKLRQTLDEQSRKLVGL